MADFSSNDSNSQDQVTSVTLTVGLPQAVPGTTHHQSDQTGTSGLIETTSDLAAPNMSNSNQSNTGRPTERNISSICTESETTVLSTTVTVSESLSDSEPLSDRNKSSESAAMPETQSITTSTTAFSSPESAKLIDSAKSESTTLTTSNTTSNSKTLPEGSSNQLDNDNKEGATALPEGDDGVKAPVQSVYHVKWINYNDNHVAIVTQNENGPCPLLAITNVLLLQGKIKLPGMVEMVTSGQLMEYLGDFIFTNMPKDLNSDSQLNWEQNMSDAVAMFHKLQTGLDVNVRFTGVGEFEYTNEMIVFDLLGMRLYHGWLVDPESVLTAAAVGNCTYNQLVEKIISLKGSDRPELVTEALEAEQFLEKSSHQLTYHGLSELVSNVNEDQLCVFFRNNHFSTLYKHKNELFLLVTDQGFLTESNVVWETLCNVEGDCHFVDAEFHTYRKPDASTSPITQPAVAANTPAQMNQDYLLAMSLQQEQQEEQIPWGHVANTETTNLTDHELAMRLQEEENQHLMEQQQQQQQQQAQQQQRPSPQQAQQPQQQPSFPRQGQPPPQVVQPEAKKEKDCIIL